MPDDDWIWDKTDTHIYLTDIENNQSVQLRRIYKFFEKLEIANVSKKTCDKLYKHGFKPYKVLLLWKKQNLNLFLDLVKNLEIKF